MKVKTKKVEMVKVITVYLDYENRCEHDCSGECIDTMVDPDGNKKAYDLFNEILEKFFGSCYYMYYDVERTEVPVNKVCFDTISDVLVKIYDWITLGSYACCHDVNKFMKIIEKYYSKRTEVYQDVAIEIDYDEDDDDE